LTHGWVGYNLFVIRSRIQDEARDVTQDEQIVDEPTAGAMVLLDAAPPAALLAELFQSVAPIEPAALAQRVETLLAHMLAAGLTADLPLTHHHADGMYARELRLPAGTFAIGEIQKRPHINVLSAGRISMLGEHGGIVELVAPCTFPGKPGVRKVGFVHEDVVWTTVHNMDAWAGELPPERSEPRALEDFLVARTPDEYQRHIGATQRIAA